MKNPAPKLIEDKVRPFSYLTRGKIRLERPKTKKIFNFFELSLTRKSRRNFGALLPGQLSELLWYAAKAIETFTQNNGYVLSHRPSASAGARHPIDILICQSAKTPTLAYYNPFDHSLNSIEADRDAVSYLMNHVDQNLSIQNGVFLWLLAHPSRTAAKYEFAESLVWRDAGALLQQIQLTATALSLNSCPIGTLAEPFAGRLFGQSSQILSAGGIIVGT